MSTHAPETVRVSSPDDVHAVLPDADDAKTFFPHSAQHPRGGQSENRWRGESKTRFLRFGSDKQAHYSVPVGDRPAYVLLGSPDGLQKSQHITFDHVLGQLQRKMRGVMALMPEYAGQPHVEPRFMVYKPGTYQTTLGERLGPERQECYALYFSYGNHHYEMRFGSDKMDTHTTQRAVNRFLEEIRSSVSGKSAEIVDGTPGDPRAEGK